MWSVSEWSSAGKNGAKEEEKSPAKKSFSSRFQVVSELRALLGLPPQPRTERSEEPLLRRFPIYQLRRKGGKKRSSTFRMVFTIR